MWNKKHRPQDIKIIAQSVQITVQKHGKSIYTYNILVKMTRNSIGHVFISAEKTKKSIMSNHFPTVQSHTHARISWHSTDMCKCCEIYPY